MVRVPAFQAGCRGFESRLPLHTNSVAMKTESFHGLRNGLVAQGQSGRLITGWSQVRILPGPLRSKRGEDPLHPIDSTPKSLFSAPVAHWSTICCGAQVGLHSIESPPKSAIEGL